MISGRPGRCVARTCSRGPGDALDDVVGPRVEPEELVTSVEELDDVVRTPIAELAAPGPGGFVGLGARVVVHATSLIDEC
ncbi:MAG: hypothetical protein AVDCRST_MAG60-1594 [uncultured Nocardioides sp.]|uniref:Uncharacterized protein n=1 Tax=uncultured Nocardioides sp. TaxID=198441 RepID=A0A6J4NLW5_9ACTN|nr:MAG: hypothetical protein AVDCRST_MAG60-1594 [uncultured Nocardioides sp.]